MSQQAHPVEKKLSEEPIILPASPFWEVFRVFGRDELIALAVNVISTAVLARFVREPLILSLVGPIAEKFGFFIGHFKDAWSKFSATPKEKQEKFSRYVSAAFKGGFSSLGKDIAAHDPLYASFMFLGLSLFSSVPVWLLSLVSFLVALAAVVAGEVALNEIRYSRQAARYKRAGFGFAPYLEARFYIKNIEPEAILNALTEKFGLTMKTTAEYHDRYITNMLKRYNGRKPMLRFRQRTKENESGHMQTLQLVYTRVSEMAKRKPRQFNYYPTRKDKLWFGFSENMPWTIDEITDQSLRALCASIASKAHYHDVYFTRSVARDPKTLLVSVDRVRPIDGDPFTVVEIKSHLDAKSKAMLIEAMRFVMFKYEVVQTTHGKSILTSLHKE